MSIIKNDRESILIRLFTDAAAWEEDPITGCWEWTRFRDADGYGRISTRVKNQSVGSPAPRVALRIKLGRPIKPGMLACHTCDNRGCVNPGHIYEGTPKQNTGDMMKRSRHNDSFKKGGLATRKLTREDAVAIRERVSAGAYQSDLAKEYGVSASTITDIVSGKNYGFEGPAPHKSARARRKWSDEQMAEAKSMVRRGVKQSEVCKIFGMDSATLSLAMSGKLYKDIP